MDIALFNSTRYDISFRTADHIIGEWSKPQKLVDGWQYSQLYGSYIHPISLKGNILYFIMSMWLPYNILFNVLLNSNVIHKKNFAKSH